MYRKIILQDDAADFEFLSNRIHAVVIAGQKQQVTCIKLHRPRGAEFPSRFTRIPEYALCARCDSPGSHSRRLLSKCAICMTEDRRSRALVAHAAEFFASADTYIQRYSSIYGRYAKIIATIRDIGEPLRIRNTKFRLMNALQEVKIAALDMIDAGNNLMYEAHKLPRRRPFWFRDFRV